MSDHDQPLLPDFSQPVYAVHLAGGTLITNDQSLAWRLSMLPEPNTDVVRVVGNLTPASS